MQERLKQYIRYIINTGRDPLPTEFFDDDWEPIGPGLRAHLVTEGAISVSDDGIHLTDIGRKAVS
ncbi:hypothetical protein [Shumkonia mesophila]|uniref:hypothetical protein n=1 Tax=Shumkonia mesophila TaxID=2838854 RepID=UPI002934EA12|nr:hypothetical protein [Shumkonia mesophila]